MKVRHRKVIWLALVWTISMLSDSQTVGADEALLPYPAIDAQVAYGEPVKLCELDDPAILESSGLAISRRFPNVMWTHNDSGDQPRIFAFDERGRSRGTVDIDVASAHDWEDMASFQINERSYLLIADVGSSRDDKADMVLHLIDEPDPGESRSVRPLQSVRFQFESGACDCEAVAFDTIAGAVLMATKELGLSTRVFQLPWPKENSFRVFQAEQIATIRLPMATAMDVTADGRRAVILSYGNARVFTRAPNESWQEALSRPGVTVRMPVRKQGESICFGADRATLFLTSEKLPTPVFKVPAISIR